MAQRSERYCLSHKLVPKPCAVGLDQPRRRMWKMDRQNILASPSDLGEKLSPRPRCLRQSQSKIVDQSGSRHCKAWGSSTLYGGPLLGHVINGTGIVTVALTERLVARTPCSAYGRLASIDICAIRMTRSRPCRTFRHTQQEVVLRKSLDGIRP